MSVLWPVGGLTENSNELARLCSFQGAPESYGYCGKLTSVTRFISKTAGAKQTSYAERTF